MSVSQENLKLAEDVNNVFNALGKARRLVVNIRVRTEKFGTETGDALGGITFDLEEHQQKLAKLADELVSGRLDEKDKEAPATT